MYIERNTQGLNVYRLQGKDLENKYKAESHIYVKRTDLVSKHVSVYITNNVD